MVSNFRHMKLTWHVTIKNPSWHHHHSEMYEWRTTNWQHVRGSALIISMKAISVAFDISSTRLSRLPPIFEYAGYALCPANLVLGPFVTFSSYSTCHQHSGRRRFGVPLRVLAQVALNCALSLAFINLSSCFLHYMISSSYLRWVTESFRAEESQFNCIPSTFLLLPNMNFGAQKSSSRSVRHI